MSEIEKLMQNAGIEKAPDINNCYPEMIKCHHCEHYKVIDEYTGRCLNEVYPEFTAEKQLELIKWLAFRDYITIVAYMSGEYHSEHDKYNANENSLEGCLARLINNLWQDLTEAEKAEIKGILE